MHRWLHRVVVVACDADTQLQRLMRRDSSTREHAQQRIDAQMPLAAKIARADVLIDNNAGTD